MRKHTLLILLLSLFFPLVVVAQKDDKHNKYDKYLEQKVPENWVIDDAIFEQTLPVDDKWWQKFNDTLLDSIIVIAIDNNYSVLMAMDRMRAAKYALAEAKGAWSPSFELELGWLREQTSGNTSADPQDVLTYSSGQIAMSWEIDIFGTIRNRVRAEKATYNVTKQEYNAAMVSLCAQVATAYFNLREMQQEYEVTERNVKMQWEMVNITQKRYEAGLVSKLDVAQALSSYYSSKSSIPSIEASIIKYANALGVLLGMYPEEIRALVSQPRPLPEYIEPIGVGIPANLLMRRPDIREAEYQIAAQAAELGVTRAEYWPSVYVNGNIGFASHDFNKLFNHKSLTYEIAPTLTWTFFQGTQNLQAVRQQKALLDEYIKQFNYDVLNAVQEVDVAINAYKNSIKQIVALREVVNQGKKTYDLSVDLYKQGLSPFQNVLDAQQSLLEYENSLTEAQGNSLIYLVQLYQSLGGGWGSDK